MKCCKTPEMNDKDKKSSFAKIASVVCGTATAASVGTGVAAYYAAESGLVPMFQTPLNFALAIGGTTFCCTTLACTACCCLICQCRNQKKEESLLREEPEETPAPRNLTMS